MAKIPQGRLAKENSTGLCGNKGHKRQRWSLEEIDNTRQYIELLQDGYL